MQFWILEFWYRYNLCHTAAFCCNVCFESDDNPFFFTVPTVPIYNILWSVYYGMYSAQLRAWNYWWDANIQCSLYLYILHVHLNCIFVCIRVFSFYLVSFVFLLIFFIFYFLLSVFDPAPRIHAFRNTQTKGLMRVRAHIAEDSFLHTSLT